MDKAGARRSAAWIIAGALVATGVVVVIVGVLTPVAFGWFAYQPLAAATFAPATSGLFLSRTTIIGWLVLTIGLLIVAYLLGRRAGSAKRASAQHPEAH
ncbi:hypothetical protein ACSBPH_07110 [Microbacterium sp. F51-2R]|jgi:hypothetical protein|uniref:hypothetical protein n=1 Tax=Microbacterium sp. F51-2R TaxID=3445777 RepID=UPI003F9F2B16